MKVQTAWNKLSLNKQTNKQRTFVCVDRVWVNVVLCLIQSCQFLLQCHKRDGGSWAFNLGFSLAAYVQRFIQIFWILWSHHGLQRFQAESFIQWTLNVVFSGIEQCCKLLKINPDNQEWHSFGTTCPAITHGCNIWQPTLCLAMKCIYLRLRHWAPTLKKSLNSKSFKYPQIQG